MDEARKRMDEEKLVDAYLKNYVAVSDEFEWAVEALNETIYSNPMKGLMLTELLIQRSPTDRVISRVAAGPLEDLLTGSACSEIWKALLPRLRTDKRLQYAITQVWLDDSDTIFKLQEDAIKQLGIDHANPLTGLPWND